MYLHDIQKRLGIIIVMYMYMHDCTSPNIYMLLHIYTVPCLAQQLLSPMEIQKCTIMYNYSESRH